MPSPCNTNVAQTGTTPQEAEQLLARVKNLADERARITGEPLANALRAIAGELVAEEKMMAKIYERNALLTIQKKQDIKSFASRFKTLGEGLLAFLQGSSKIIQGSRLSVDYQAKALHGKYFGSLISQLEDAEVLSTFKHMDEATVLDVYREMGSITPGQPAKSITNNDTAFKIAQIIENTSAELVARQNRAGAFIRRLPGYVSRQTHDQAAIRALGSMGNNPASKNESYAAWRDFILPLVNHSKTFQGADPEKVLRQIHEGLYSGIHGPARDEANVQGVTVIGSLANKVSQQRVLHFKDAESAFKYNRALGIKDFKEQILHDLHVRTRSIALMENLGPSPEASLKQLVREMEEEARTRDDAAEQVDSLKTWRIQAAMNEITGRNEMSANPTLSNITGTIKVIAQMAKMGGVVLSSLSDKVFLQAEMAHQGIGNLDTLAKQITGMFPRGPEQKRALRLMGVAMDGLMGNALSRYSNHSSTSGWAHAAQKHFFDLNLLNSWTDANKATAAELMAANLGEHADLKFSELPAELSSVLTQYDITPSRWEALRSSVVDARETRMVLPDQIKVSDEVLAKLVSERGLTPTAVNKQRELDALETALRTYIQDRVDIAVPTPGAAERKYSTFDTKAGTPLGEAVRMMMLFKSFPITVMRKILGREIYGRGADTLRDWLLHDHRGKFNLAMLIAMGTAAGYLSGALRDTLKGRTPKPLLLDDGSINYAALNDAAIRGGSLGILGDVLMTEYDSTYRGFLDSAAGPIVGQLDQVFDIKAKALRGENVAQPAGKLLLDNAPMINLFYIRPVLDYLVFWNLQEMLSPGSLGRMESNVERKNHQGFWMRPSETIK